MDILKKVIIIGCVIILSTYTASSQTSSEIISAFQDSYIHEASGELQKATESLKQVYSEKSYEINLRLGWLTYSSGLFTESMAYYRKAMDLKPYAIEAKYGYVYPAAAVGNWTSVIQQYENILEISPNNSITLHRLGLIYYGREDYTRAYAYFEKVVNLFPFDYDGLIMFAWTNLKLHKTREAKVLFEKALMNTPGGSSAVEGLEQIK